MDVSEKASLVATGHERVVSFWKLPELTKIKDIQSGDPSEVHIRTQLDPTATILISSSTNKLVTIYDVQTGLMIS
jgi:hypothetical protein